MKYKNMRLRKKLTATCAVPALSLVSLVGIPATNSHLVGSPLINEFMTDTQGIDMAEYVEILGPEGSHTCVPNADNEAGFRT